MNRRPHAALRWIAALALLLQAAVFDPSASAGVVSGTLARRALEIERLLAEWQVDRAEAALAPLLTSAGQLPEVLAAAASVRFYRGDHQAAVRLFDRALAADPRQRLPASLRELALVARSTAALVGTFVAQPSAAGHFLIRSSPGRDELLAPFAGETLEALRDRLERDLGYAPREPIVVEFYAAPEDLARASPLTVDEIRRSGTIAICKYNRLMIVSPAAMPRGYPWRDTLAHEYVHLVLSRMARNQVPIWLQEGLAKLFETRWRSDGATPPPLSASQEHLLGQALTQRALLGWNQMHPSMAKLPSQQATALAFAQVQTAMSFLVAREGAAAPRRLVEAIAEGAEAWEAIGRVAGLDRRGFDRAWRHYLRRLGLRRYPGLVPAALSFGPAPSHEAQIRALRARRAQDFFRLADMLRQRGLRPAALVEYRKALGLLGGRDPLVANALARTYLETDAPERAVDVLVPLLAYYPELAGPQTTMGVAYLRLGKRQDAAAHLEIALRINPFAPELHCSLAKALPSGAQRERHARFCQQRSQLAPSGSAIVPRTLSPGA
ncbi:MAG: hypothetical protein IPL40_01805 [Proteobacteria bacterium]|nr:hypothetical protein [Pseudomonadota bacterium]